MEIYISNPDFKQLGYIVAGANLKEKHDRSAPSDYHWKILKCRMIIFSYSDILAGPDGNDVKKIHIIFSKTGGDFDKVNQLLKKNSLTQESDVKAVNKEVYKLCFHYTMIAKMAPTWNILGDVYLINNRHFLTDKTPQQAIQYSLDVTESLSYLRLRPVKITIFKDKNEICIGERVKVLPSLKTGVVVGICDELPESSRFKCYKDLKRHWKNIHGYRLSETEGTYYLIQFWRGDPFTYPDICVTSQYPLVIPMKKSEEKIVINNFLNDLKNKIPNIVEEPMTFETNFSKENFKPSTSQPPQLTQAVSLCTPTQYQRKRKLQ